MTSQVRDFVQLVLGDMRGNAVVGLMDKPGPKGQLNRFHDFVYPDQLDEIVGFFKNHSNEDAYLSPLLYGEQRNEKGKVRRIPENALTSQTIYQDSDTCEPQNFRLPPSIHLTTSSGKYQDFWVLTEPISAKEASDISHKVAIAHRDQGSDPSSWSANKLLRVPNTVNTRHGFPEQVQVQFSGVVYNFYDVAGAYENVTVESRAIIRLPAEVNYEGEGDLPDYATALDKLPSDFDLDILTKEHKEGTDRSRLRYRLLCDLFRTGLDFEDVLSLAWNAPVSRKWKEDPRNLRGLIAEALKAQQETEGQVYNPHFEPSEDEEEEGVSNQEWPKLLTEDERDSIRGDQNFLRRYDEFNRVKLGRQYNGPYVRMHAWQVLSAAFSTVGFIPRGNGPEGLNLFSMIVGDSGSGKTTALKPYQQCLNEIFGEDKGWYIGSNASPNALHEKLLERDGKFSVLNADEAHGWFRQVNTQQWADGIYEALAGFYDGDVPPMLRTGNREISGKSAKCHFNMHLQGTMDGELSLSTVLTRSMFLSGFLARFIWTIGEPSHMTQESMEETQSNADYVRLGYEPVIRQWAAEFSDTKTKLRAKHKRNSIAMMMDSESLARMSAVKWQITEMYRGDRNWEILQPSVMRLGPNIRRAASLLALEEGEDTVSLRHTLIAIEAAEEWVHSLAIMADKISDSEWKRLVEEVYQFIASKDRVSLEAVNRRFDSRHLKDLTMQIETLKAQGRVKETLERGKKWLNLAR